jgi:hypothetical protein
MPSLVLVLDIVLLLFTPGCTSGVVEMDIGKLGTTKCASRISGS